MKKTFVFLPVFFFSFSIFAECPTFREDIKPLLKEESFAGNWVKEKEEYEVITEKDVPEGHFNPKRTLFDYWNDRLNWVQYYDVTKKEEKPNKCIYDVGVNVNRNKGIYSNFSYSFIKLKGARATITLTQAVPSLFDLARQALVKHKVKIHYGDIPKHLEGLFPTDQFINE